MTFAVQIDRKANRRIRRKLNKVASNLERAHAMAANRAATSTVSTFAKTTIKTFAVKASKLKEWSRSRRGFKGTKIIRAKPRRSGAAILVSGSHIPLYAMGKPVQTKPFHPKRKNRPKHKTIGGTKVTVYKGKRELFPGAFISKMSSSHKGVFRSRGENRLPIDELFGPSVMNLWIKRENTLYMHAINRMKVELARQIQFYRNR